MNNSIGMITIKDYKRKKYTYIGELHDGLACVRTRDNLYGYINQKGEEVIPCIFVYADDFSEGLALTLPEEGKQYQFIKPDGSIHIVCPKEYIKVGSFHDGRAVVARRKYQYGYIDKSGKEIIPCQFFEASDFSEGLAVIDARSTINTNQIDSFSKRLRFIDVNGKQQWNLTGNYRYFMSDKFQNGLFPVQINSGCSAVIGEPKYVSAFIDKKGHLYTEKSEIEALETRYRKKELPHVIREEIKEKLIIYCSEITFLGKSINLIASTPEDLLDKKKKLLADMKKVIEATEQTLLDDSFALEKPKEKIKV